MYSSILNGYSYDIKVHPLSDDSGYYIIGKDSSNIASIWKYLYSSPSSTQCQQIFNFQNYAFGQLKISDTSFFFLGNDPLSFHLHLYRFTFSNTTPDWASLLHCASGSWVASNSESLILSSTIYSFFPYGSPAYLYFVSLNLNSGTASLRYKSSGWSNIYGSAINGDYVAANACSYFIAFNIATNSFICKQFTSVTLYGMVSDPTTGR